MKVRTEVVDVLVTAALDAMVTAGQPYAFTGNEAYSAMFTLVKRAIGTITNPEDQQHVRDLLLSLMPHDGMTRQ